LSPEKDAREEVLPQLSASRRRHTDAGEHLVQSRTVYLGFYFEPSAMP